MAAESIPESRPQWPYKMPLALFNKLHWSIVEVRHRWEFTGVDTAKYWVEAKTTHGADEWIVLPNGFDELFVYKPNHRSLFELTYKGKEAWDLAEKIHKFDVRNDKERREYERLKAKFEPEG